MIRSPRTGFVIAIALPILALALAAPSAEAQFPKRQPTPNDTLKSTEAAADKKVTFRIYAPKAEQVAVGGDFGQGGAMSKDAEGVWSLTVGPLKPDYYSYVFIVDGVRTVDPKSAMVKPGLSSLESLFVVPGDEAEFETTQAVHHGEVRTVWYESSTLGVQRRMHVYTPPGYENGTEKYPVFYLLHGGGDDDFGWSTIGRAGFILDNLIAAKKAVPMVVVMPNGSLPPPKDMPPRPARGATPSPEFQKAMEAVMMRFTHEVLNDVIPAIEKTYRVKTGSENRALAGLSMGGGQTLGLLISKPDHFAYVGIWSAGLFGGNADAWEKRNEKFLAAVTQVNSTVKRLEIVVGDQDFALAGSKALSEVLKKRGIEHELRTTGGGHTWINWRHYLNELAPKLFR
jgi:enterochelin esterase-like enzyme